MKRASEQVPMPGDAIVLTEPTFCVWPGAYGILEGTIGEPKDEYLVVFNTVGFRGGTDFKHPEPAWVSCSGGPGIYINKDEMRLIGTKEVRFWRWKTYRMAHGGERYSMEVALWEVRTENFTWLGKPNSHLTSKDWIQREASLERQRQRQRQREQPLDKSPILR